MKRERKRELDVFGKNGDEEGAGSESESAPFFL